LQVGCQFKFLEIICSKVLSIQYFRINIFVGGNSFAKIFAFLSSIYREILPKPYTLMIRFRCPSCGILLGVSPRAAGITTPCPLCRQLVLVSAQSQPPRESLPADSRVIPPLPEVPTLLEPPPLSAKLSLPPNSAKATVTRFESIPAHIVPKAVKTAAFFMILGVPVSLINLIFWGILSQGVCCLSPLNLLSVVWPVLGLVQGIRLRKGVARPEITILLQILLICNLDFINFFLGIAAFAFLSHPTSRAYFAEKL
jgi:hypothetical protein